MKQKHKCTYVQYVIVNNTHDNQSFENNSNNNNVQYTYTNQNSFEINVEKLASFSRTVLLEEQNSCSSFK